MQRFFIQGDLTNEQLSQVEEYLLEVCSCELVKVDKYVPTLILTRSQFGVDIDQSCGWLVYAKRVRAAKKLKISNEENAPEK